MMASLAGGGEQPLGSMHPVTSGGSQALPHPHLTWNVDDHWDLGKLWFGNL